MSSRLLGTLIDHLISVAICRDRDKLQLIAGKADGDFQLTSVVVWDKSDLIFADEGLVRLVDRPGTRCRVIRRTYCWLALLHRRV
jgi:hypothetical protein